MSHLFFWQAWHPDSRRVYVTLLLLLAGLMIWFGASYLRGIENVIEWERLSNVEKVSLPTDEVSVGVFDFSYEADYYLVTENYWGSNLRIDPTAAYVLLGALALTLIFLLVIISTFTGFWFYFGTLLLIALILGMKWEQLQLFGTTGSIGAGVVMVLYLPATYFFQKIKPHYGLIPRLLTFTSLTLVVGVLVHFFAEVPHPALYLISYGLVIPVVLSLFFVLIVGHELVSFFLKLITQNNTATSKNTFLHFAAITVIYLGNLGLLVLKNIRIIDWDILYFNAFLLLIIATLIGIWGFRDREIQYRYIVGFQPLGAYLYGVLAIITFATLGFFAATANDPILETFEDTIVYSQIGYGLIFFVYVIANFVQGLATNGRVYRTVYQPPNLPYGTMQIVGLVATIAFFARAGLFPFYQAVAGYNNALGDLYQYEDDLFLAEQYYKLGDQYGYKNHRSNYALGALARAQNDPALTTFYFNEAVQKNPTPQAYVNLGSAFLETNQFFEAVFAFRQGLDVFPQNAYLQNNLALTFGQTSVLDSALYYLQRAATDEAVQTPAEANTLAVLAQSTSRVPVVVDSLVEEVVSDTAYRPIQINALTLLERYGNPQALENTFRWQNSTDSTVNSLQFAHLYNHLLVRQPVDTALVHQGQQIAEGSSMTFNEPLSFASAVAMYRTHRVVEALKAVDRLQAINPFKKGYYLHLMGLWALEQHAPRIADRYFEQAVQAQYDEAVVKRGVSLSEAAAQLGDDDGAVIDYWNQLLSDSVATEVARDMLTIFSDQALREVIPTASDALLYQALRYRYAQLSESLAEEAWQAFDDPNYRALLVHDLSMKYPDNRYEQWNRWADEVVALDDLSAAGQQYVEWIRAFRAEQQKDLSALAELIEQLRPLSRWHQYWLIYFRARLAEQRKHSEQAHDLYALLTENPFFSEGLLAALNYLYPPDADQTEAYQRLLDAIQTNPYDASLLRAYVLAALRVSMDTYAEEGLADYQKLVSPAEYQAFLEEYERVKASLVVDF